MFRVTLKSTNEKRIACGITIGEVIHSACTKFGLEFTENIYFETVDGYPITDDDGLAFVTHNNAELLLIDKVQQAAAITSVSLSTTATCSSTVLIDSTNTLASSSTAKASSANKLPWPMLYVLPDMPILEGALQKITTPSEGAELKMCSRFVNRLVNYVFSDMLRFFDSDHPYPSTTQYCEAAAAVVVKYPFLADCDNAKGSSFWKVRIIGRFREHRKYIKEPSVSMLYKRQKHSKKRTVVVSSPVTSFPVASSPVASFPAPSSHVAPFPAAFSPVAYFPTASFPAASIISPVVPTHVARTSKSIPKKKARKSKKSHSSDESSSDESSSVESSSDESSNEECLANIVDDHVAVLEDFHESFGEEEKSKRCDLASSIGQVETFDAVKAECSERLRKATGCLCPIASRGEVLKKMKALFQYRVMQSQTLTVSEEVELYPHLKQPFVLYQEALLIVNEYAKAVVSDYSPVSLTVNIPEEVEGVTLMLHARLKGCLSRYRYAAPYKRIDATTKDVQMQLGLLFATIRLGYKPGSLFSPSSAVYIHGTSDLSTDWTGVSVNGVSIATSGIKECIGVFIASVLAFNLNHVAQYEGLSEFLEFQIKFRHRCTKRCARNLLNALPPCS